MDEQMEEAQTGSLNLHDATAIRSQEVWVEGMACEMIWCLCQ